MADRFSDRYIATAKVDQLRDELAAKRRELEERQRSLVDELKTLEAQESVLALLRVQESTNGHAPASPPKSRKTSVTTERPAARAATEAAPKPPRRRLKNPKDAVRHLLRESSPLAQTEIVGALENDIEPRTGRTARKTLTDVIWMMKKRGEITVGDDGLISLRAPEYQPKGPMATIVFDFVKSTPGQSSAEIADRLTPRLLEAGVRDEHEARKTTFRTLFNLRERQHVIRQDTQERWYAGPE